MVIIKSSFSESAKNVQVADAFIRFHKEIFPK